MFGNTQPSKLEQPVVKYEVVPPRGGASPDYGRAKLITEGPHDLAPCFAPNGSHLIPLAEGLVWNPLVQQGHCMAVGATRSGKSVLLTSTLLCYAGSCFVIDPRGDLAWAVASRRRSFVGPDGKPHRVVILDPWGEVNRRYASKVGAFETVTLFNPLSALDPGDLNFADDCLAVADALILDASHDPHWSDSARELVAGLVAAVVEANPGHATLADVRLLLNAPLKKLEGAIKSICLDAPRSLGAQKLGGFLGGDDDARGDSGFSRDFPGIRSTARTQTALLDNRRLQAAMATDDPPFDLAELATGRVTLFLVLPVDRLRTHGRWLRLILTLAIGAIARQDTPPALPVLFMLDEMGTIGKLVVIEQAYGLMAGAGIRLCGFVQDISQLQRDYPQSWSTFFNNSQVKMVLQADDNNTTEYVSQYLGTTTVEQLSPATIARRNGTTRPQPKTPEDEEGVDNLTSHDHWVHQKLDEAKRLDAIDPHFKRYKSLIDSGYRYKQRKLAKERTILTWAPDPGYFHTRLSPHDRGRREGQDSTEDLAWERALMLPQEVAEIAESKVLVSMPGRRHYLLDRLVFHRDPRFAGLFRPNPLFAQPAALPPSSPSPEPVAEPVESQARWFDRHPAEQASLDAGSASVATVALPPRARRLLPVSLCAVLVFLAPMFLPGMELPSSEPDKLPVPGVSRHQQKREHYSNLLNYRHDRRADLPSSTNGDLAMLPRIDGEPP